MRKRTTEELRLGSRTKSMLVSGISTAEHTVGLIEDTVLTIRLGMSAVTSSLEEVCIEQRGQTELLRLSTAKQLIAAGMSQESAEEILSCRV